MVGTWDHTCSAYYQDASGGVGVAYVDGALGSCSHDHAHHAHAHMAHTHRDKDKRQAKAKAKSKPALRIAHYLPSLAYYLSNKNNLENATQIQVTLRCLV